jgi:hypothetical protein
MNFSGKRILFISPKFHDYENMIKGQLEVKGAVVDFYPERSYNYTFTFINNFFNSYLSSYQARHYHKITDSIKGEKYDYLFVIRGYMLPETFLIDFKNHNPEGTTIMYQWDSERTNPFAHLIQSFDKVKSFDFEDCENFNIDYVSLFYTKDVENYRDRIKHYQYDFFFMGVFFEERYEAILKFKEFCTQNGYKLKSFLFMPFTTRVKYFLKGKKLDQSVISFKHMDRDDYLKNLSTSRIMVDVSNPRQTGLAMRVIESLACKTKIVTSNIFFRKDKLVADSGLVSLFDSDNIRIEQDFFDRDVEQNQKVVFSLEEWLIQIFFGRHDA